MGTEIRLLLGRHITRSAIGRYRHSTSLYKSYFSERNKRETK